MTSNDKNNNDDYGHFVNTALVFRYYFPNNELKLRMQYGVPYISLRQKVEAEAYVKEEEEEEETHCHRHVHVVMSWLSFFFK